MAETSECRMELGTYISGFPKRGLIVFEQTDSLFSRLREHKQENGEPPILLAHTLKNPSLNYDPPLAENQVYIAFRREPDNLQLRDRKKLGEYVDGLNASVAGCIRHYVPNIEVVNEGSYEILGTSIKSIWIGLITREGKPQASLTTVLSNQEIKEGIVTRLDIQSTFMLLDKDRKIENDITLGSATYIMEKQGPILVALGIYIDAAKRHPIEKAHAISSSLEAESRRSIDKCTTRKEIVRAITPYV